MGDGSAKVHPDWDHSTDDLYITKRVPTLLATNASGISRASA